MSTSRASSAVASTAECFVHAFFGAGEDVGAGAHGAADQDGLAGVLVINWDEWVVRRERTGGSFSVNE